MAARAFPGRNLVTALRYRGRDLRYRSLFDVLRAHCRGEVLDVGGGTFVRTAVEHGIGFDRWTVVEPSADDLPTIDDPRVSVRVGQPPREVATLSRGQYFGEMSLLTGEPRSATVVAIEDTAVLEFDRGEFQKFFNEKPELAVQMAEILALRKAELATDAAGKISQKVDASGLLTRLRRIFTP